MQSTTASATMTHPAPQRSRIFFAFYPSADFVVDFEYKQNQGLDEQLVKRIVTVHLESEGYIVKCGERSQRGPDVEAFSVGKPGLVIEAKGEGSKPGMFRNFFLAALGQIILRMGHNDSSYIVALPCHEQFVRLVRQVPLSVCRMLNLQFWLIEPTSGTRDYCIHAVQVI